MLKIVLLVDVMLPRFKKGDVLTAAQLEMLAARVRRLQLRAGKADANSLTVRRAWRPAFRYGFQLAVIRGCIYYMQGWVQTADAGRLLTIGKPGWNEIRENGRGDAIGATDRSWDIWVDTSTVLGGGYLWVFATPRDPKAKGDRVTLRLGYTEVENGEVKLVQLAGGLLNPFAPVMPRGTCLRRFDPEKEEEATFVAEGDPLVYGAHDCAVSANHTAGALAQADGYELIGYRPGLRMRNEFVLGYAGGLSTSSISRREQSGNAARYFRFEVPYRAMLPEPSGDGGGSET